MDEMFYGTLPQDTQDFSQVLRGVGRSIGDIGRGVSYYPYDLLGAPVDIINMALQPVGLGSERPVLGSDYLRNIAQSLGYAQPSTGSGAETAGRLGAAFVNPAAGARAVGQAGNLVTKGANLSADKLVQMITGNPQATAPRVLEETSMPFMQAMAPRTPTAPSLLDNPNLKNWVKGSDAVKESGEPITLYHATTHDFDTFSMNRANPENHYGKAFYLTDSVDDANLNYAGIGPDLEIRIEQRTERLADELMDMSPEEIADMATELKVDKSLINLDDIEKNGASPELIREIATKELTTHGGAVMPVFARLQNPVKVGTKDETKFRIDVEFDDDGDIVSESGNGIDLYNSLNDVGRQYDIPNDQINDVWAKISDEMSGEEIAAGRVDKIIRENIYDVYTPDGELAGPGQFIADVFRDMGFDGIKMDAGKYFGPRQGATGVKLKGMEGVEDATHYIVFEPTQIKSAIGNVGTYSLTDPSILRGAGAAGAGLLGAGMMQDEEMY
jgi:hypothetical protein